MDLQPFLFSHHFSSAARIRVYGEKPLPLLLELVLWCSGVL